MPEQDYESISLKELIQTLLRYKKLIVLITLSTVLLSLGFTLYQLPKGKSASIILAFEFPGIETHTNPDGSKFDPYQVASPYILSDVIGKLKLEGTVSPNAIRALIEMKPLIPNEVISKQEYALEKEGGSFTFFPNEYILTVKSSKNANVDAGLAQKIANQISSSYRTYFSDTYLMQKPVTNRLSAFNQSEYDYSDISMVLHGQTKDLLAFNEALSKIDPDFRSKRTGMAFSDLVETISLVDDVDLNKLDSIISAYKLTKDKKRLIVYYEYLVEQLELQKNKFSSDTTVTQSMLESIEDSNNSILTSLTGTIGTAEDSTSYFNSLIMTTASSGTNKNTIQQQINFYSKEIEELRSGAYITTYDEPKITAQALDLINSIDTDLKEWIQLTNLTSAEFYDQYLSSAFYALSPAEIYSGTKVSLNLAIGLIVGLMLGVFVAFFKAYWENEK